MRSNIGHIEVFREPTGMVVAPSGMIGVGGDVWFTSIGNARIGRVRVEAGLVETFTDPRGGVELQPAYFRASTHGCGSPALVRAGWGCRIRRVGPFAQHLPLVELVRSVLEGHGHGDQIRVHCLGQPPAGIAPPPLPAEDRDHGCEGGGRNQLPIVSALMRVGKAR